MHGTPQTIAHDFAAMGARLKIIEPEEQDSRRRVRSMPWRVEASTPFSIDVRDDGDGEYFQLRLNDDIRPEVGDVRSADRHLLLTVRTLAAGESRETVATYLCGHDERHWFVAAVPERAEAGDVQAAMDALKPQEVWDALRAHGVPAEHRNRRRTTAFIRQGEWFFIPRPSLKVNRAWVLRDEPIRRGAGKPHGCQFLYRDRKSGEWVWVRRDYPNGLTEREYRDLSVSERRRFGWERTMRNARVYVKGNIRHPDHKTVWLSDWHEVVMNTETHAEAMEHVAFLD